MSEAKHFAKKHFAKKREAIRAAQWSGEMTPDVADLIGQRKVHVDSDRQPAQLMLGNGWYARVGDWICSTSGEDLSVISDEVFRNVYEEVDETGRPLPPSDDEHETAGSEFVRELDVLLLAGLKLSREEHPNIFRERDRLVRTLRHLFEDQAYVAARSERQRIKERIVKEIVT